MLSRDCSPIHDWYPVNGIPDLVYTSTLASTLASYQFPYFVKWKIDEGRILNGFGFGFRVPVLGFGDQVNLKCVLKACVCATFL